MMSLAQQAAKTQEQSERRTAVGLALYEKRRPWSRTDSARWLDARSEAVLARLRRLDRECPPVSKLRMGHWLKEQARDQRCFARVHEALTALGNDVAREQALVLEILK
jgi:hypothetical protein